MSGAITAAVVVGTAYNVYQGEQQAKQAERARAEQAEYQRQALQLQEKAQGEAKAAAQSQAKASEQQINAVTRKSPDVSSIQAAAESTQQGGVGSTMLTGPAGVDPNELKLGKSTLLGA
jgi:regulator of protease activity HflC (stomatin/prohibitin superfamily)